MPGLENDAVRHDREARRIVSRWRSLTGGRDVRDRDRRTLVACSGGADSTALVLVLAAGAGDIVVGHVMHDIRAAEETAAERDRVAGLAAGLGLGFVEASVRVRDLPGNTEGNARRARYRELERMGREAGCPFVATAHQANDQMETLLMAMLRGAGIGGLSGMPARRALGTRGIELVRPMLEVGRTDAERLCGLAGVAWAADPTNADISRLRAALRHGPVAAMEALRPRGVVRAAEAAERLREVRGLVDDLAGEVVGRAARLEDGFEWSRAAFAGVHPAVLSAALRRAYGELHGGRHADRLAARSVRRLVAAIGEAGGGERRYAWKAAEVVVGSQAVTLRRVPG